MSFIGSTQYYLYRSPPFMLFIVSGIALFFTVAAIIEGALRPPMATNAVMAVLAAMVFGAMGMGHEVAQDLDE